jgi:hypothetical protein
MLVAPAHLGWLQKNLLAVSIYAQYFLMEDYLAGRVCFSLSNHISVSKSGEINIRLIFLVI